jgi:hypothetical protein
MGRQRQTIIASMNAHLLLPAIPLAILVFKPAQSIAEDPPEITQQELVRRTQELCDSATSGDQAPWRKYLADDGIFADEKGRQLNKQRLVADIRPLPNGYSGTIKLGKVQSIIHRDTAILSYDLDETEIVFGQNLTARYHTTDTWLRRNGIWQVAASQAMRYYEDPAVGKTDPARFADFVGTYELAPGETSKVLIENGNLYLERNDKREQLLPEAGEIFFRKGIEGRVLFRHAENGKVDALVNRRNNEDIIWRKTGSP